jgi:hypothetical protein
MTTLPIIILSVLIQSHLLSASTFQVNCSLPLSQHGYVSAPPVRSTLSILWSALFTIFICTWSVQHLSVPPQKYSGVTGFFLSVWRKLEWMLLTLFMPELLLARALGEFVAASYSVALS